MTNENETIIWKRTLDGIYHIALPKRIEVTNLTATWSKIFNDYAEHFAGTGPLLALIDGSPVEYFDEKALSIAVLHIIPGNNDAIVAIHSRSPAYRKVTDSFFRDHPIPQNMHYFDDEQSAKLWLHKALDKYNAGMEK